MTNPDVLINFALDRSGSMHSVVPATIEGFNSFIQEQRDQPGDARLSLTLFNTTLEPRYVAQSLHEIPPLAMVGVNAYQPGGGTALLDAVGSTIKGTEKWLGRHPEFTGKVVCVILTDGEENSSREWHIKQPMVAGDDKDLGGLIQWKQSEGWEFVFLGSGGSDWLERTFGHVVDANRFVGYAHSNVANSQTYGALSSSLTATRSAGSSFIVENDQK